MRTMFTQEWEFEDGLNYWETTIGVSSFSDFPTEGQKSLRMEIAEDTVYAEQFCDDQDAGSNAKNVFELGYSNTEQKKILFVVA